MKCAACNQEIQGKANFCPYCGNSLEKSTEPMEKTAAETIESVEVKTEPEAEIKKEANETPQSVNEKSAGSAEKINPLIMIALGLIILAVIAPIIMPVINYKGTWQSGSVTAFTIAEVTDAGRRPILDETYAGGFASTLIYCGSFLIAAVTFFRVYVSKKGYIPYLLTIAGFCWGEYQAYTAFSEGFVKYHRINASISIGMGFVIALFALAVSLGLVIYYQKNQPE